MIIGDNFIEVRDLQDSGNVCTTVPDTEERFVGSLASIVENAVIICGGEFTSRDCFRLNPETLALDNFACMKKGRTNHISLQLDGDSFWILGEHKEGCITCYSEIFNTSTRTLQLTFIHFSLQIIHYDEII